MAAAKPEAAHPPAKDAAAKDAAVKDTAGAAAAAPEKAAKPMAALLPVIAVVVLAPVLSFAVGQFVLIPQLKKQLAAPVAEHGAAEEEAAHEEPAKEGGGHGGGHGKKGEATAGAGNTYEFENIVVNLAGTMGTRYLKTTFMVTGVDKGLRASFEKNKPKLVDVTLNVLSSLSLADLEEAGSKNIIREKLITAYNQVFERRLAEQVYFVDFVVQ